MNGPGKQANRLCIVSPCHPSVPGGSEYQIECLLNVLIPLQRYEIFYLAATVAEGKRTDSYHTVRIGHSKGTPRFGYLMHMIPLYQALATLQPNVIYQRVGSGYTGIAAYFAHRHRKRLVWHVASDTDVSPQASLEGRNPLRRFLEKRSVEYGIRRADCIVTQTSHQARLLELNYRRRPDAIVPNFHPEPRERIDKSGPLTVAWVSSFKTFKRPDAFLDLADALRERTDVRFIMIGALSGTDQWNESMHRRIQATPNLEWRGARSQDEVNEVLAKTHVFVNTSRYEGFPNTFIQAWMREAVVVSLHVDPDGLLANSDLGVFCGDSEQRLTESVRRLLTDDALRARLAAHGRQYAMSKHSLANANELIRLLEPSLAPS